MIYWILKPRPYPAFVLLAIIFAIFGFNSPRQLRYPLFAISAILLITFIRGLIIDLSIGREGLIAFGRVTKVDRDKAGWTLHFTFPDRNGVVREQEFLVESAREARRFREGAAVKIRYHPKYPLDVWRWLDDATDATEDPESKSPDSDAT